MRQAAGVSRGWSFRWRGRVALALCWLSAYPATGWGQAAGSGIRWRNPAAAERPSAGRPADVRVGLRVLAARPLARHAVVRLDGAVTPAERAELGAAGVQLLSYLGGNAFFVVLDPAGLDAGAAVLGRLIDVQPVDPKSKLHPFLAAGATPDWAVVPGSGAVPGAAPGPDWVAAPHGTAAPGGGPIPAVPEVAEPVLAAYLLLHPDVALADAWGLVDAAGGVVRCELPTVNGLVVEVPRSGIAMLSEADAVQWIEPALPRLEPVNDSNRQITQADEVQAAPYGLDGSGVTVLVYDSGSADATHLDFGGRLTVRDGAPETFHSTHVAGTIGGDGAASAGRYRGMAPGVQLESYGYEWDQSGTLLYTNPGDIERDYAEAIRLYGADLANNSIGINICPNGLDCELAGDYGVTDQLIDAIVGAGLGTPIRIVWANGNERTCERCRLVGVHVDGGYHSTAPPACAKNHITVGALNSDDDSMTSFSSWGPTDDGRLKPDICAPGCQKGDDHGVTSPTYGHGADTYYTMCGTSMAAPTVTGLSALVLQDFRAQFPQRSDLSNSALKALLLHNAQDIEQPGPDYRTGYGSVRIRDTIDFLRTGFFADDRVDQDETYSFLVQVEPGDTELKVTLVWDDVPGTPNVVPALVNDLDLLVFDPESMQHFPWTLDPQEPVLSAVQTQPDRVNNVEQVYVEAPAPGMWLVQVHGYNVPQGPQAFSVCGWPRLSRDCDADGLPDDEEIAGDPTLDCTGDGILDACEPDCDGDGTADSCEIQGGDETDCNLNAVPDSCEPWADCNTNGVFDACDISGGGSLDCDDNWVPDECQADCNTNGIADPCDLADGSSADCNVNAVPDSCDLATGASLDCNANGLPDECDLAALTSDDCNGNSVPDECDVGTDGTGGSVDCDSNGVPDECSAAFGPAVNLSNLNDVYGFAIRGLAEGERLAEAIAGAGDLNADGIADLIIGAPGAAPDGTAGTGRAYVVFGAAGLGGSGSVDLEALDGADGFAIDGADAGGRLGISVAAAGDINDDGIDDVIIGANKASPPGHTQAGKAYVVFGASDLGAGGAVSVASLDGDNGFAVHGIRAGDDCGVSVNSAGDVNADGVDDLIVGAWKADPGGEDSAGAGYVVFGGAAVGQDGVVELSDLNGDDGFVIRGLEAGDWLGYRVAPCGDINADGVADLAVSAVGAHPDWHYRAGVVYVIYGSEGLGADGAVDLTELDGSNGFVLQGMVRNDMIGSSLGGAGDVNGDGVPDLLVGAPNADPGGSGAAGTVRVVYGRQFVGGSGAVTISAIGGPYGLVVNGIGDMDAAGFAVAGTGDVNGDGLADFVVSAIGGDPNGAYQAGEIYVVFGDRYVGSRGKFDLTGLDGGNGFVINGVGAHDYWGWSVTGAGDVNDDGVDDVVVGTPYAEVNGRPYAGASYVVFGRRQRQDCDGNEVPDVCDLADGALTDVFPPGGDGIPDECQADCNSNGVPDAADIRAGEARDCNHNTVPDACDINSGVSLDQMPPGGDGIPDDCQADCNTNGIPDGQDVQTGASPDCNRNLAPDECEVASGDSPDCNSNGVPDGCDLFDETSNDCNTNQIPDECDTAEGTSPDCNGNSVPDECEPDCNSNGVADECDIADGTSADVDHNGVPDECHNILRVPAAYGIIQGALNAAEDGDSVLLADGVYGGAGNRSLVFWGKAVLLCSENGPAACVLDGGGADTLFLFVCGEGPATHVRGLTIRNGSYTVGGGVYCESGSPTISDCLILDNEAILDGGGVYSEADPGPIMRNCIVSGNVAGGSGGGLAVGDGGGATLLSSMVTGNSASSGGGVGCLGGLVTVGNCTFWSNAAGVGGAIRCTGGTSEIRNTILWGNHAAIGPQLALDSEAEATTEYCDVAGGAGYVFVSGGSSLVWQHNIDVDPMFVDAGLGDMHLLAGSDCIDGGDPEFAPDAGATDVDGEPRMMRGRVDVGADEFGDDCNDNGVSDLAETAAGDTPDVNGNRIPDECEPPVVEGSYSAQQHGGAGTFRLPLGGDAIEPRRRSVDRLEFDMSVEIDPQTAARGGVSAVGVNAGPFDGWFDLSLGEGGHGPDTRVVVTFDPPLDDRDCWTVELVGLTGRWSGLAVYNPVTRLRTLRGDLDRDGFVTRFDLAAVKPLFGAVADEEVFPFDLNINGIISTGDFSMVKPYLGHAAAECP